MRYLTVKEQLKKEKVKNEKARAKIFNELGDKTNDEYELYVNSLIRQKYSLSNELAIIRQKDEKPLEWQEYFNYVEECKKQAKKN